MQASEVYHKRRIPRKAKPLRRDRLARFTVESSLPPLYQVTAPATRRRACGPSQNRSYYTAIVSPVPFRSSVSPAVEEDAACVSSATESNRFTETSPQNPIG